MTYVKWKFIVDVYRSMKKNVKRCDNIKVSSFSLLEKNLWKLYNIVNVSFSPPQFNICVRLFDVPVLIWYILLRFCLYLSCYFYSFKWSTTRYQIIIENPSNNKQMRFQSDRYSHPFVNICHVIFSISNCLPVVARVLIETIISKEIHLIIHIG